MDKNAVTQPQQDLAHLRPSTHDEIDLGELLRNLFAQWKLIAAITAIGIVAAVGFALLQPNVYRVNAVASIPTLDQLGESTTQELIPLTDEGAFSQFLEQLTSFPVQQTAFLDSELRTQLESNASDAGNFNEQLALRSVLEAFNVSRMTRSFVELGRDEVAPLRDVNITLETQFPEQSVDYINTLLAQANTEAVKQFERSLEKTKSERIDDLNRRLEQSTRAAKEAREAEIQRIEEAHAVSIAEYEQQIALALEKARVDRLNRITQLEEALATAKALNITEPVTWDDLRPAQRQSQITNQLNETTQNAPLYFQGSRVLTAEIDRLKNRTSDEPFVASVTELRKNIAALKNDPKLEALRNRADDTIYLESYNSLLQQLADVEAQPTVLPSSQFVNITVNAITPSTPVKPNRKLIVVAGAVLAGFFGLFVALIRLAVRKD